MRPLHEPFDVAGGCLQQAQRLGHECRCTKTGQEPQGFVRLPFDEHGARICFEGAGLFLELEPCPLLLERLLLLLLLALFVGGPFRVQGPQCGGRGCCELAAAGAGKLLDGAAPLVRRAGSDAFFRSSHDRRELVQFCHSRGDEARLNELA